MVHGRTHLGAILGPFNPPLKSALEKPQKHPKTMFLAKNGHLWTFLTPQLRFLVG